MLDCRRTFTRPLCEGGEETYETNPGRGLNWIPCSDKTASGGHRVSIASIRASLCTDEFSV